jgi:translation initiation factor IF-3
MFGKSPQNWEKYKKKKEKKKKKNAEQIKQLGLSHEIMCNYIDENRQHWLFC